MNTERRGIGAYVYRSGLGDCTNGGISGKADRVIATGDMIERGNVLPSESDDPHFIIVEEYPTGKPMLRAYPIDLYKSDKWVMFGGNFLYSSDSRFPDIPVKIFDRVE